MLVIALAVSVLPVFVTKKQAGRLCFGALPGGRIAGRVGSETTLRAQVLTEKNRANAKHLMVEKRKAPA
ncbi:MAG: DUF4320 family protein [Thermincola sp.]|nr:DUF4320 family protein [Thermincola sp.]